MAELDATRVGRYAVTWGRLFGDDSDALTFDVGCKGEADSLLVGRHYLGPATRAELVVVGHRAGALVAVQVWVTPTARHIPSDGTWLELARWCLTPEAGDNAGSRQHAYAVRTIKRIHPRVTTLVSYSDPSVGHTGTLYRACNWQYAPTHHSLRYHADGVGYASGHGSWDGVTVQAPKDRWIFPLRRDLRRDELVAASMNYRPDLAADYSKGAL